MPFLRVWRTCGAVALALVSTDAAAATITVRAGDSLQAALNAARPGDVVLLQAGARFVGNFVLPVTSGATYITVRSSAPDGQLPGPNVRITPDYAALLPKIQSDNSAPALRLAPGAHHWRLQFLEFPATLLGYNDILRVGEGSSAQSQLSQVPYEIDIDRVYVHGDPLYGQKRGIALNGRSVTIRNSYISDIKAVGFDTQAIGGWNGPGPFTIENNYLEGAGENFILGGSDPPIQNLVSEDVVVRYNHMSKPWSWRDPIIATPAAPSAVATPGAGSLGPGTYRYRVIARRPVGGGTIGRSTASPEAIATLDGTGAVTISWPAVPAATEYRVYGRGAQYWTVTGTSFTDTGVAGRSGAVPTERGDVWQVKNVFELKNARRVTVEYNIFENNWQEAQPGYAILFTPRNQDGACPWCVVEDVTFQYNVVRHTASGINLSGYDWPNVSAQTNNVRIRHNVFYDISTKKYGGAGWFLLIGDGPRDITVDHNTIDFDGTTMVYAWGGTSSAPRQITGFSFTNNAGRHNQYGINGASYAPGMSTIGAYFPGGIVAGNWIQGGTASRYPVGNLFSGTYVAAFVDVANGDYRPSSGSVLLSGSTDGTPIGADLGVLNAGVLRVTEGNATPRPTPPVNLRIGR
ncbi:MAG TPA: hypothetical protein VF147_03400 [Vicinamibacterales bacterium]